jgi:hypothetical protein
VSADQWQLSLRQLYGTADLLEAGVHAGPSPAPTTTPPPLIVEVRAASEVAAPVRSTTRAVVSAAVHSALTVGVLLAGFAVVDPLLPHPERPHLADPVVAMDAIPQSGAYRP